MENRLPDPNGDVLTMLWLVVVLALIAVTASFVLRIYERRKENSIGASKVNGRTATTIEGEDLEDLEPEEQLAALATAVKNLRHRQGMLEGRLNRLAPPAVKVSDPPSAPAPRTRADVLKSWRERNANSA